MGRGEAVRSSRLLRLACWLGLLALSLVLAPRAALGAVAVANTTTNATSGSTSTLSISHATGSGANRLMLVGVSVLRNSGGGTQVNSVSYAGNSLTLVGKRTDSANAVFMEIWRLVNPPNVTSNVVVTLNGSVDGMVAGVMTFTGVDQTTPLGTFASNQGSSANPSVNVSSATGELVFDTVAFKDGLALNQGAGQTERWDRADGQAKIQGNGSTEAGAASVTMSWSQGGGSSKEWAIGGVSIKPTSGADVKTTKTGSTSVTAGANLTYTITVTNLGSSPATNLVVTDLIPTNSTFVSASSGGTYNAGSGTVTWTPLTNFTANATTNFTVTVTVPANGPITNKVSSTASTTDPDASNNNGTASDAIVISTISPSADVQATKAGTNNVLAGDNLTYTITVTNLGPSSTTNLVVTDRIPTNSTFVSASSGGTYNAGSGTVTWTPLTNFTATATTNFTVTVTAPGSGPLTNVVSSTSSTADPDASNNNGSADAARVITSVTPRADVQTTKTGTNSVPGGANLTYTITVTNVGPTVASNLVVTDLIPTNSTFVSASAGGSYNAGSGTVTWPAVNYAASARSNLTVTITAPGTGPLTNVVSSTSSTPDPDAANNDGSDGAARVITSVTPSANVRTTKTGASTVDATSNLTYTITVTNLGPLTATNLVLVDTIPTNSTFVSASSGGTYNAGSGTVTWPGANYTLGASSNFTVTVQAPTSGSLTNTVSSTATTPDPDASNNNGTDVAAKVITSVITKADIQTTKTGTNNVQAGANLTYTITITNVGPSTASNVVVSDVIPTNSTFVSASAGGNFSGGVVTWPTVNYAAGAISNLTVTVTAPGSGWLTNVVSSTSSTTDPDASNNNGSADAARVITSVTPRADVQTTKTGTNSVLAGANVTYTITVTNVGASVATNVVVTDLIPTNSTFVSASAGGSYNAGSGTVTWPAVNYAASAKSNLTVTITAPGAGPLTNVVSSTSSTPDPDSSNNDGSAAAARVVTSVTPRADVRTTKTGTNSVPAGASVSYTITVTNLGPSTASNVVVSDVIPTNSTFLSASGGGSYSGGVVTWPAATYAASASSSLTVTVKAPSSGSLTNVVSSTSSTSDPDASNNNGSAGAARVITSVVETPGLDGTISTNGASGICDNGTVITLSHTTAAGSNRLMMVGVSFERNGSSTRVVNTVTYGGQSLAFVGARSDSVDKVRVEIWRLIAPAVGTDDVVVTLNQSSDGVVVGAMTFNGVDQNNPLGTFASAEGHSSNPSVSVSSATGELVFDTVGVYNTQGSMTAGAGQTRRWYCTVADEIGGAGSTEPGASSVTMSWTPANGNEWAIGGVSIKPVASANVAATKTGPSSVAAGTNFTYTITVTNLGPSISSNLVVSDTLPAQATFVSASSGGSHNSGVVTWTATRLLVNGATNFTVTVTAPANGSLTNYVASSATTADPDPYNNNGSEPGAQVITSVIPAPSVGVNVSGYVYLDANKNGFKDGAEAGTGLSLFAKIVATTNAAGPALQAATVNSSSGAYTFTNILTNTWCIIVDNNSTLSDVTPTIPSGWSGIQMPAYKRTNVAVAAAALTEQNFGLVNSVTLAGRVFKDTGTGGGTANDGVLNGGETGLPGVTVKLTDNTGATNHDIATTDGSGNYTLRIPSSIAGGTILKVVETNTGGHLSTGGGAGDTGGSYDRASDAVTFTVAAGTSHTGVNFGDAPQNSFQPDNRQANLPGTFVLHAHTFLAGSAGSLNFSVAGVATPSLPGWSQVIYRDANCNGQLEPSETVISGAIAVSAGDKVCLFVKDFIPVSAPLNAQNALTVTASLVYSAASPALTNSGTRSDLTVVGPPTTTGLTLVKTVDKETALPGETLTYTVTYANLGAELLRDVVVYDATPAFTTFVSAGNGALPSNLSGVSITQPSGGGTGSIRWTFTGTLAPGSSGTVTYTVTVGQ